jgi:HupE/UreJ protein
LLPAGPAGNIRAIPDVSPLPGGTAGVTRRDPRGLHTIRALHRTLATLSLALLVLWSGRATAHDLALDQLTLWPARSGHLLRGELTLDPELTRAKGDAPSPRAEQLLRDFVSANVRLSADGRALPFAPEVRELWVRGGATLGDLVVFSAPLPEGVRDLRAETGPGLRALIVSVQVADAPGPVRTTSWLLGRSDTTPVYRLGQGWQAPGAREGGAEAFAAPLESAPIPTADRGAVPAPVAQGATSHDSDAQASVPPAPGGSLGGSLAARFVRLGFEHILPGGFDHVLFVVGLVLGSRGRWQRVLLSLSLFTLAHSVTLALGQFRVIEVPARWVEALIAVSIFAVGVDNLRERERGTGEELGRQLLVFGFGLIHGLGFASALAELSFDPGGILLALLSFNVGVELGQLTVALSLMLVLYALRDRARAGRFTRLAGSALVAACGLFLIIDRLDLGLARPPALSQRMESQQ